MKWTNVGTFTTEELSTQETITEIRDVVGIAETIAKGISPAPEDLKHALIMLEQVEHYMPYLIKKVDKALKYVPEDIQEKEHL